jgi:hypothetical protein
MQQYDIFEVTLEGPRWKMCVKGTAQMSEALELLGKQTTNECFAMDLSSNAVVARVNDSRTERSSGIGPG